MRKHFLAAVAALAISISLYFGGGAINSATSTAFLPGVQSAAACWEWEPWNCPGQVVCYPDWQDQGYWDIYWYIDYYFDGEYWYPTYYGVYYWVSNWVYSEYCVGG